MLGLIIYSLINFAYFEIFNTFLELSVKRVGAVNEPLLALLKDFYLIVPRYVYVLGLLLLGSSILVLIFQSRSLRNYHRQLDFYSQKIDFLKEAQRGRYNFFRFGLVSGFIFVNLLFGVLAITTRHEVLAESGDRQVYLSKIGLLGHLFYSTYDVAASKIENIWPTKTKSIQTSSLNIFEQIGIAKERLADLGGAMSTSTKVKTPKFDKPNIIFYQMESVGAWALKQEPTPMPFLASLIKNNLSVDKFYSNSCTTNNAEFASMCGFYPESYGPMSDLYAGNNYYCLPGVLKERYGYTTAMFHANDPAFWNRTILAPKWGIDNMYFTPTYKVRASDMEVVSDMVAKMATATSPTFNYFVSFLTHAPHEQKLIDFYRSSAGLDIKPYTQPLNIDGQVSTDETTIRNYFGFLSAEDAVIKQMFAELETKNLLQNTIVVLYTDHRYYPFAVGGNELKRLEDFNLLPFVIYLPEKYTGQNKHLASQVDIAPTIMNLLEGADYKLPASFIGRSLFDQRQNDFVINKCLGEVVFANNDIVVKKDLTLNKFTTVANLNEFAQFKISDYQKNLETLIDLTDRAVQNNLLGMSREASSTVGANSVSRVLDLNQLTDTDKDGLSDMREKAMGTDRKNPDTDGDGYLDGEEVLNGYNPLGEGRLSK
ncbi:MAG: sulfatase-like hydrolase/transferase [bacterium]